VAVVVLAATVTLTSCSTGPAPGPLGFGGDGVIQCVPVGEGGVVVVGDVLTGLPDVDAEIIDVDFVDASGVSVRSIFLMEILGGEAIGSATMPPENPPSAWDHRVDAVGGAIPSGSEQNLLLVVERTGPDDGSVAAVRIDYEVNGVAYRKTGTVRYRLTDAC
jgi:hypothetical protein